MTTSISGANTSVHQHIQRISGSNTSAHQHIQPISGSNTSAHQHIQRISGSNIDTCTHTRYNAKRRNNYPVYPCVLCGEKRSVKGTTMQYEIARQSTINVQHDLHIPDAFWHDLEHAVAILKEGGCQTVFLFGSLVQGTYHAASDIDLAIEGCPKGTFFALYSRLYMELDTLVDLVDLDTTNDPLVESLRKHGRLYRVG